ncbi:MAG: phosphopantetheine-binding protein [Ilumatobacter sp.]|uniref:acyl carrier protein n=1 Tax=Ilumatobacter sp. TaxID=1967498 RepID=UPI0026226860|nr:phosphopantetheine-binding protein [Ilumatobacter sp.]MDJ0770840.1 phosphopantetheine-binding protein [Ilumatobacter sp.]
MSCRPDVVDAVVEVTGLDAAELHDAATLESLDIDSLDLIEVAMIVEERRGVEVAGDDFEGVTTFGGAVAVFDRLLDAGAV